MKQKNLTTIASGMPQRARRSKLGEIVARLIVAQRNGTGLEGFCAIDAAVESAGRGAVSPLLADAICVVDEQFGAEVRAALQDFWAAGVRAAAAGLARRRSSHLVPPSLLNWAQRVSQWQAYGLIDAERLAELEALGFSHVWLPEGFDHNLRALASGDEDVNAWKAQQRERMAAMRLTPGEFNQLDATGFSWGEVGTDWYGRYMTLGWHLNCQRRSLAEMTAGNDTLPTWVREQQRLAAADQLDLLKRARLEKLGIELAPEPSYAAVTDSAQANVRARPFVQAAS